MSFKTFNTTINTYDSVSFIHCLFHNNNLLSKRLCCLFSLFHNNNRRYLWLSSDGALHLNLPFNDAASPLHTFAVTLVGSLLKSETKEYAIPEYVVPKSIPATSKGLLLVDIILSGDGFGAVEDCVFPCINNTHT